MVCITLNVIPNRVIACICALGDTCGILAVLGQAVNHRSACRFTYADEILRFAHVGQRIGGRSCCDYRCCLSDGKVNAHGLAAQRNRSSIIACVHGFAGKGFAVLGKGNGNIRIFQRAGLRNDNFNRIAVIGLAGCADGSGAGVSAVCAAGFGDGVAVCGIGQGVIFACRHITALGTSLRMGQAIFVVGILKSTFVSAHEVCTVSGDDNFIVVLAAFRKCHSLVHFDFPNGSVAQSDLDEVAVRCIGIGGYKGGELVTVMIRVDPEIMTLFPSNVFSF